MYFCNVIISFTVFPGKEQEAKETIDEALKALNTMVQAAKGIEEEIEDGIEDRVEDEMEDEEEYFPEEEAIQVKKAKFNKVQKSQILSFVNKFGLSSGKLYQFLHRPENELIAETFENVFTKYKYRPIKLSMFRNMVSGWIKCQKQND